MPLRHLVTRSLVSLAAVAGLGAAFVAGTTFGWRPTTAGTGDPRGRATDAAPAAYTGSGLSVPDSCDDLLGLVRRPRPRPRRRLRLGRQPDQLRLRRDSAGGPMPLSSGAAGDVRAPMAPARSRSTNGETGTNVQEAGVDEPDVVKTDGRTLFRVQDGDLVTYDVTGAEVDRLASLALPDAAGADSTEILLSGDTVVALTQRRRRCRWRGRAVTELVDRRRVRPGGTRRDAHGRVRQPAWSPPGCTTAWSAWCSRPGCPTSTSPGRARTPPTTRPPEPTGKRSATAPSRTGCPTGSLDGGDPAAAARLRPGRGPRRRHCRSAPSPSSASTPPRPTPPRSAAWPSTPTWPTPRPTSSTSPPARRTAGSSRLLRLHRATAGAGAAQPAAPLAGRRRPRAVLLHAAGLRRDQPSLRVRPRRHRHDVRRLRRRWTA